MPFSVVVPAKDEGTVVERCLSFMPELAGEVEVVVVANGCSDDTAARARRTPGVHVLELPAGGKAAALNAGDAEARYFPRVYLDADIVVSPAGLRRLVAVLAQDASPAVAGLRPEFVTRGRPLLVRLFFSIAPRLPYVCDGMVGSGIYALNEAGRARFDAFPALTADDLYVQRLFRPEEVRLVAEHSFRVETPRTLADLIRVRTRVAAGNAELAATGRGGFARTTSSTSRALAALVLQRPSSLPAAAVYLLVSLAGRWRARRPTDVWHRDSSTR